MPLLILLPFDILLTVVALVVYLNRPRVGGLLGQGLKLLLIGVLALGSAHSIGTLLFAAVNVNLVTREIVERLFVTSVYILIIVGFIRMRRALGE